MASMAVLGAVLVGCKKDNAKYSILRDQAFIAQTETKANASAVVSVAADKPEGTTQTLNVRLNNAQDHDRKFRFTAFTAEELAAYNQANGTSYEILPANGYKFSTNEVVVKAGSTVSEAVNVTILPLSTEQIKSGVSYVLPVKMHSVDEGNVLLGADEYLYLVKPTIITSVPVLGSVPGLAYRRAKAFKVTQEKLDQWTVEFRVNMSGFSRNNQAIFGSWGPSGKDEIYIRFGDEPMRPNFQYLQAKFGGTQFDKSNTEFERNRWYHIALVYNGTTVALYVDGQKDLDTDKVAGQTFTLGDVLHICSSGGAWFVNAAMLHEMRVWKIARTPSQLKEFEYGVSPKTPGLLHYWKMDEGQGGILKNSVEGAPNLEVLDESQQPASTNWLGNVRSDGAGRTTITD